MATKPKAILSTHDGREASPITKASNVLFENGQTAQDILNDRQDAIISPVIENSSSMFKVGQGDNVDYSDNVVNGAYESMVLKGKTMVNCIQEPSSQDVVLPYEFADGQYVTINDTKESGALGVELKGQTLVNMDAKNQILAYCQNDTFTQIQDDNYVTVTVPSISVPFSSSVVRHETSYGFIEGKTYTIISDASCVPIDLVYNGGQILMPKSYRFAFVAPKNMAHIDIYYRKYADIGSSVTYKFPKKVVILEGDYANADIPYFEGMTSCKMPILHTVGKNLFDLSRMKETGSGTGHTINLSNNSLTTSDNNAHVTGKGYIITGLKKNTPYRLTVTNDSSSEGTANFNVCSRDGSVWYEQRLYDIPIGSTQSRIIYTDTGSLKVSANAHTPVGCTVTLKDIQIEEVASENVQPTTYEPYKSSILSLPEEVVLGGLGNTRDTFNTTTGKYTKRTDTMTVTNYKNSLGSSVVEGAWSIVVAPPNKKWQTTMLCVSDKFSMGGGHRNRDCGFYENPANFVFFDKTVNSADEFIAKYGDFSFTYMLEIPVVTKINLSSTLKSWNATTHIYSEIPENTLYPTLSHSNPTYPVILKPSTKYSIVANSYSNDHTNSAINFNLGGATASTTVGSRVTTITTPSTLSNELLTMSGRGNKLNNVMVIEGDVVGDEPYFEGMCDVDMPVVTNVGKNLIDTSSMWYDGYCSNNNPITMSVSTKSLIIDVKEGKTYTFKKHTETNRLVISAFNGEFSSSNKEATHHLFESKTATEATFTIPKGYSRLCIYLHHEITTPNGWVELGEYQLEESTTPTTYEPYKSNILSCNGDKIELTKDMLEQGGFSAGSVVLPTYEQCKTSTNSTIRMRSKELIKVSPNTTYIVTNKTLDLNYTTYTFDSNRHFTGEVSTTNAPSFTTSPSCQYIAIMFSKGNNSTVVTSDFKESEFQIYEVDKTIVLRSLPNGVCDTLNLNTGEYVQRIGEKILNGTELWYAYRDSYHGVGKSTFQAYCTKDLPKTTNNEPINCNRLAQGDLAYGGNVDIVKYQTNYIHNYTDGTYTVNRIFISVNKEMFGGNAQDNYGDAMIKFKSWIQSNPITVQYQLAEPIVKTVDLSGYPFSYENGHVQLSSGAIEQSLTPKVEYSVATNRNGQIRSNQKMVERHQKQLDQLQAIILANLVNSQYNQTLTTLKYELSRV